MSQRGNLPLIWQCPAARICRRHILGAQSAPLWSLAAEAHSDSDAHPVRARFGLSTVLDHQAMSIKHLAWLHRLHCYWCGGMRLLNVLNPNLDQANRGNGESLGRYLAVIGDWTSCYDPVASQTCTAPSYSQPSANSSVQAADSKQCPSSFYTVRDLPSETCTRVARSRRSPCRAHCMEYYF